MKYGIFFLIVAVSVTLAQIGPPQPPGDCDTEEAEEFRESWKAETCEPGLTTEEASELCYAINAECNMGYNELQLEACTMLAYDDGLRNYMAKHDKLVEDLVLAFPLNQAAVVDSFVAASVRLGELLESGAIADAGLAATLGRAKEQMNMLPYGAESRHGQGPNVDTVKLTVTDLETFMKEGAVIPADYLPVIEMVCLELSSYVEFMEIPDEDFSAPPTQPRRMIAHLTAENGGFKTRISITNHGTETEFYRLKGYDSAGNLAEEVTGEVHKEHTAFFAAADLFSNKKVSHFVIDQGEHLEISASYSSVLPGSPAQVKETLVPENRWRFFAGDWEHGWDGLAIVNLGWKAAAITIRQLDEAGGEIRSVQPDSLASLASMAKGLVVLNDLGFENIENSQFQLIANQPVSVIALRGNREGPQRFLWSNLVFAD